MKISAISGILMAMLVMLAPLSYALDTDINTFQIKDEGSNCFPVQVEKTRVCYCVDEHGNKTGESCTYIDPYSSTLDKDKLLQ